MDSKNLIQWKNPQNKQWTLYDTVQGKIKGTSPEKYPDVPLAKSQAEMEFEDDTKDQKPAPDPVEKSESKDDSDNSLTFF